jgi:hypothetical protein
LTQRVATNEGDDEHQARRHGGQGQAQAPPTPLLRRRPLHRREGPLPQRRGHLDRGRCLLQQLGKSPQLGHLSLAALAADQVLLEVGPFGGLQRTQHITAQVRVGVRGKLRHGGHAPGGPT